ncbi:MAG: helix-turn-helix transcriptional regulator [Bacteroidia bacterium]
MNHLSRLLAILTILKSKRIVTGTELAKKFEVSLRTIYRDIKKLEESGVPIMTIEGRGYSIMDGYTVPPIMFDEIEVNALITAEKLIAKTNDDSLIKHFGQTLEKIKSVFKSSLQSQGELLDSKMLILKSKAEEVKSTSLSYIQMAIINFSVIEILYKAKDKETTFRKIEPLAIYSYNERWIVIGWCRLRDDYRAFRLDRIKHFKILEEKFEDRNFDLGKYFLSCEEIDYNP